MPRYPETRRSSISGMLLTSVRMLGCDMTQHWVRSRCLSLLEETNSLSVEQLIPLAFPSINTANDSMVKLSQLVKLWRSRLWRRNSYGKWEVSITLGESVLLHRMSCNPGGDFYIRKSEYTVIASLLRGHRVMNVVL
jgi:hypothetical protein